MLAGSLTELLG
ncbi:hypothetical protein YPPY95_3832, partial [Yersinia pestis PY-95]